MATELSSLEKISISSATLASLLQRFAAAPGDVDGLLFGDLFLLPPSHSHDDDDDIHPSSPSSSSPASVSAVAASLTGHFCSGAPMSFYDPFGRVDPQLLARFAAAADHHPSSSFLGWFSGRRRSPLRPSMRELAVSISLSKTLALSTDCVPSADLPQRPCIFLLLSSSASNNLAVHTHEYRAFVLRPHSAGGSFEPRSLHVINVGPAFRGQYGSFLPESALPWMPCRLRGFAEGDLERRKKAESISRLKETSREKKILDALTEGFSVERLERMVGPGATEYTAELEDLYGRMLRKLEILTRQVEKTSARVLEQESHNSSLRRKLAGLE